MEQDISSPAGPLASLLSELETVRRLARYYPPDHPAAAGRMERLEAVVSQLPPGEHLVQVRPQGFFAGDDELHRPGHPARRLAGELFAAGIVALVLRPPVPGQAMEELVRALAALPRRPGPADRTALLEAAGSLDGVELVPLDVSRFVFGKGGLAAASGRSLWRTLVTELTGGALGAEGEGGLDPREMARLVEAAGDPTGFLELLIERFLRLLGRAEERHAVVEGLGLIGSAEELVRALSPDRRHLAARLMVQHAAPPESLAARLPEVLEPELVLDAVEGLLASGIEVPAAVQRLVYQLAAPPAEARDPWRRRGLDLDPDTVDRARTLLQRIPGTVLDSGPVEPVGAAEEPWKPEVLASKLDAGEASFVGRLREALRPRAVRQELEAALEAVLAGGAGAHPSLVSGIRRFMADGYFEHLELGEFRAARRIVRRLVEAGDEELLERLSASEGLEALLAALGRWGKEHRREVLGIVQVVGEGMVPAILARLAEEKNLSVRRRLLEMVVAIGRPAVPHLQVALHDRRWFVVRNALLLLRRLKDPDLGERARPLLDHGDPRVVAEAVLSLVAAGDPEWIRGLDRLLGSSDPRWLHEGAVLAGKLRHPEVGRRLVAVLRARTGTALREPVTLELIEVAGGFPLPEVEAELERLATLSQWRHRFRLTPVWEAVARAASRLPDPAGRRLLERLAGLRDPAAALARRFLARRGGGE